MRIWAAAVILASLLVSVVAFSMYRHWHAFRQDIHKDAALLIRINVDQIYRILALDYISGSGYYNDGKLSNTSTGLKIPADVLIYTLNSKSPKTFVSLLELKDPSQFQTILRSKLQISRIRKQNGIYFGISANGRIAVMFNEQQVAMSYSLIEEKPWKALEDLLLKRNLLPKSEPRLQQLKSQDGDVSYIYKQQSGNAYFRDGHIHFNGYVDNQQFRSADTISYHRKFNPQSAIKMWFNGSLNLDKIIRLNGMPPFYTDTLLKYYGNQMEAELIGQVIQRDSLISYEYNDDFEKIPKLSIKTSAVPKIIISIESDPGPIVADLKKQGLLNNMVLNKKIFPLYDLYWKTGIRRFQLSTDKNPGLTTVKQKTDFFFGLQINFDLLLQQNNSMSSLKIFSQLKNLTLLAKKAGGERSHFELDIHLKNNKINAMTQLLRIDLTNK